MKFDINLVFCALVFLTDSLQTKGQCSPLPSVLPPDTMPSHAGTSKSPILTEEAGTQVPQGVLNPAGWNGASAKTTTLEAEETVQSETLTRSTHKNHLMTTSTTVATSQSMSSLITTVQSGEPAASTSAVPHSLSSLPAVLNTTPLWHISTTESNAFLTREPITTSTSSASTSQDTTLTRSESSTAAPTQPTTTSHSQTSPPGHTPLRPTYQQVPSELNVGDEDKGPRHHPSSPLDPLLAGLLSVFIVTTAIVFVVLFLRFRQRTNNPEFHRLQDLPMDDLMEDMPLSRYTY
ncbi:hypothetical protein LDENG_00004130 [Lucifuga dentata]|nr:hypothetical protein LDENG_00004130 [Lucifuga dentata]